MKKLRALTVFKKNLIATSHSKFSLFILILAPLLLILIAGSFLNNTSIKNIKTGVYAYDDDIFKQNFINRLNEHAFSVSIETDLESCKEKVISSENDICLEIINNLNKNTSNSPYFSDELNNNIKLYVDFSKQRVVWEIIGSVQYMAELESNRIKDSFINDLHKKLDEMINSLIKKQEDLNSIILSLSKPESDLRLLKTELVNANNELAYLEKEVDTLSNDLYTLKNSGLISKNTSIYDLTLRIDYLKTSISQLRTKINSELNPKVDYTLFLITDVKERLQVLKSDLNSAQKDLEQLKEINLERVSNPISLTYESVVGDDSGNINSKLGFFDYLFPEFILIYTMLSCLIFTSIFIFKERSSGAFIRNNLSKASCLSFILGDFIFCFFVLLFQVLLIIIIGNFFVNINLLSNIASLTIICLISISIFILIGMIVGYIFNSQDSISISVVSLGILFLIFSSLITPKEILPVFFSNILSFSPISILENKLVSSIIFGSELSFQLKEILCIFITFIISSIILFFAFKKAKFSEVI